MDLVLPCSETTTTTTQLQLHQRCKAARWTRSTQRVLGQEESAMSPPHKNNFSLTQSRQSATQSWPKGRWRSGAAALAGQPGLQGGVGASSSSLRAAARPSARRWPLARLWLTWRKRQIWSTGKGVPGAGLAGRQRGAQGRHLQRARKSRAG